MEYYKIILYLASYNARIMESVRKTDYGRHEFVCYEPADIWVIIFTHIFFFVYLQKSILKCLLNV